MVTVSFRRLSDATLRKYEQLEREGTLTSRQAKALAGHRMLAPMVEAMHITRVSEETLMSDNLKYDYYGKPPDDWPDDAKQAWEKAQDFAHRERARMTEVYERKLGDVHSAHRLAMAEIDAMLRSDIDRIEASVAENRAEKDQDDDRPDNHS